MILPELTTRHLKCAISLFNRLLEGETISRSTIAKCLIDEHLPTLMSADILIAIISSGWEIKDFCRHPELELGWKKIRISEKKEKQNTMRNHISHIEKVLVGRLN